MQYAYSQIPFPIFFPPNLPPLPQYVTYDRIAAFFLHPSRNPNGRSAKTRIAMEFLRWHSDRFEKATLTKVCEGHRELTRQMALTVAQFLTQLKDNLAVMG